MIDCRLSGCANGYAVLHSFVFADTNEIDLAIRGAGQNIVGNVLSEEGFHAGD